MNKTLTEEELIELAKQESAGEASPLSEVDRFIMDLEIEASSDYTDAMNIYWVYTRWARANNLSPMNRNNFSIQFGQKFERANASRRKCYRVNKEPFELSTEEWFQMRRQLRLEKSLGKKTKK